MKKPIIIHPILLALFPVLFLFSYNKEQVENNQIILPLAILIIFTIIIWFLFTLIFKNKQKAGLFVSLFLLVNFSYGHIIFVIREFFLSYGIGPNYIILPLAALLLIAGFYYLKRTRRNLDALSKLLNVTVLCLVSVSIVDIAIFKIKLITLCNNIEEYSTSLIN